VLTGEGNGDAFVAVMGLLVGGALSHTLGIAASPSSQASAGGPPFAGQVAVVSALIVVLAYAVAMTASLRRSNGTTA